MWIRMDENESSCKSAHSTQWNSSCALFEWLSLTPKAIEFHFMLYIFCPFLKTDTLTRYSLRMTTWTFDLRATFRSFTVNNGINSLKMQKRNAREANAHTFYTHKAPCSMFNPFCFFLWNSSLFSHLSCALLSSIH